jgi:hypothetical protein
MAAVTPWIGLAYGLTVMPLALLFVRDRPAARRDPDDPTQNAVTHEGVPFREAVTSRYFVWLGVAYVAIMLAQVGVLQHLYNAVALRTDTDFARRIIQVLAGSSVVGRFAGGFVLLRVPIRNATFVLVATQSVALAGLATSPTPLAIGASVMLFGLCTGNLLMIQPLLLAEAFGVRDYGRIYSLSQLVSTAGYASGTGVIAFLFNRFGSYREAFFVAALVTLVALLGLLLAGRPTRTH